MQKRISRRNFITKGISSSLAVPLIVGTQLPARADSDKPILSVTATPGARPVYFTDKMLLDLQQTAVTTETIWTVGPQRFSGPPLLSLLIAAGVKLGKRDLRLVALNEYSVTCPNNLIEARVPIIANRRNGSRFNVRNKGPLWMVFPYDSDVRFRTETAYAVSVWQLTEIHVL